MTRGRTADERLATAVASTAEAVSAACEEKIGFEASLTGIPGIIGYEMLPSRKGGAARVSVARAGDVFVKLLESDEQATIEEKSAKMLSMSQVTHHTASARKGKVIARRFIPGVTASEELDDAKNWGDAQSASALAARLGRLLARCHMTDGMDGAGFIVGDLNLANFIVSRDGRIHLIDLAESGCGDQAEDLGELLAHLVTHRPEFTEISSMMAEAAVEAYYREWNIMPFSARKLADGFTEALRRAQIRRARPGLTELAAGFVEHAARTAARQAECLSAGGAGKQ